MRKNSDNRVIRITIPERDLNAPPRPVPPGRAGEAVEDLTDLVRAIERGGRRLADVLPTDLQEELRRINARLLQRGIELCRDREAGTQR